jgi:hypothetical protein
LLLFYHHFIYVFLFPWAVKVMVGGVQALSVPARCFGCAAPGMGRRLHACLHCVFVGCADGGHLAAHLAEHNHTLGTASKPSGGRVIPPQWAYDGLLPSDQHTQRWT